MKGGGGAGPGTEARAPTRGRLYGLLGLMLLIWAANFIFAKLAVREVPGLLAACLRTVLSGLLMIPVYRLGSRRPDPSLRAWTRRDLPRMAAVGILGIVGNQVLFVIALSHTSVAHGSLVVTTGPLLVLLGTALLGHERLARSRVAGMSLAAAGVAALQLGHGGGQGILAGLAGDATMLASAALFAGFSIFGKQISSEVGSLAVNAVAFWGGALLLLPYAAWGLWRVGPTHIGPAAWIGILYMSFAPSIVGYLIYGYALRWLPASRVASVTYLQPVGATILAVAYLGERPGLAFLTGAVAVLAGVLLVQRR
jgi:drug/metabolite transporter (DMT)-like permease